MRTALCATILVITCLASAAAGPGTQLAAACRVTFNEVAGDNLYGDAPAGVYENGKNGVTCTIDLTAGGSHYGDMNLSFGSGKLTRYWVYASQPDSPDGRGFTAFRDTGTLVLRQIWSLALGATENRAWVGYAYNKQFKNGAVRFRANANFLGDSVLISRSGPCTWVASFDTSSNPTGTTWVDAWEGAGWSTYRGQYQMPFHFTVEALTQCQ